MDKNKQCAARFPASSIRPTQLIESARPGLTLPILLLSCRRDRHEGSSENQFVVPPLGRKCRMQIHSVTPNDSA